MNKPGFESFSDNFLSGKTQLVYQWLVADTETPISAYLKLCNDTAYSFLFESVEGGNTLGRYTFIGFNPDLVWCLTDDLVTINGVVQQEAPLPSLKKAIRESHIDVINDELPPMAASGLFGFMGYDMIRQIETIPDENPDELDLPDAVFSRPSALVIFDNVKHQICFVSPVYAHHGNTDSSPEQVYDLHQRKILSIIEKLSFSIPDNCMKVDRAGLADFKSNMTKSSFLEMVSRAKEYILAGDIFQVVLSQRFSADYSLPAFDFYRALRRVNPSPFLFYLNFPKFSLAGSSPEILVRVRDGKVTIRPIAGTRKRGKDKAQDEELANDLLSDEKELAEHLMLLDLGRNDIGRVSDIGSVKVTEKFVIEYYSHVMHIISNIEGSLKNDLDPIDALMAGFPAGTVSGAPKIRAMQIIDELESKKRKYYGGFVGYLAANGNVDTCIALRTALIKDDKIYIQSGAGIVADSDPLSEYEETVNKAKALMVAADESITRKFR